MSAIETDPTFAPPEGYTSTDEWTDEGTEAPEAETPAEAAETPAEAPEAVEAPKPARKVRKARTEPAAPAERAPRSGNFVGQADFGRLRQPEGSATHAAALFAKLLTTGEAVVMLDAEVKGLQKAETSAAAGEMKILRAQAQNRIINRLLASGRYDDTLELRRGAIGVERINAQKIRLVMHRVPQLVTPSGRLSVPGKVARRLADEGKTLHPLAQAALDTVAADDVN